MRLFVQRVTMHQTQRVQKRLARIFLIRKEFDQLFESLSHLFGENRAFLQHPLQIAAWQQRAVHSLQPLLQEIYPAVRIMDTGCGRNSGAKIRDIGSHCIGHQTDLRPPGHQNCSGADAGRLQLPAERGQSHTQIGERPVAVVPEEFRKLLAAMHAIGMQREIGQQQPGLLSAKTGDDMRSPASGQTAAQSDTPWLFEQSSTLPLSEIRLE